MHIVLTSNRPDVGLRAAKLIVINIMPLKLEWMNVMKCLDYDAKQSTVHNAIKLL